MMSKRRLILVIGVLLLLALPLAAILPLNQTHFPVIPPGTSQGTQSKSPGYFTPTWWNTSFRYRTEVNFTETDGINRTNNLVDVYLTFDQGSCYNGTIVVPQYRYNTSGPWITGPIPCQVWNKTFYPSTNYLKSATVTFYVNVTANDVATYYIYYNDSATTWMPTYPDTVNYTYTGSEYVFNTSKYLAYCSSTAKGGKIYNSYNKISETGWTSSPATSNGFHWNPDYPNYDSTSRYPPISQEILSDGPLFVMYTTLAQLGRTVNATTNITYRFFEWGWICETNSTFYESYGAALYRNNEWVFNDKIMPMLTYKTETGSVVTYSNWYTSSRNIGKSLWLCFYDTSDGEAMGTVDLITPVYDVVSTSGWAYRVHQPSRTYYEYWDRAWPYTAVEDGSYIYERFANYIWDGRNGLSEFQTFANMMERDHALTISVNATQQRVFFELNVTVKDEFGNALNENVTVTVYNTTWSQIEGQKTVDSNGSCYFQLFEKDTGYWIEANLTTPYRTYTWRASSAWIPGTSNPVYNITMNVTRLYILVKDFFGAYVQKAEVSVNYTNSSLASYNISNQPVDQYYANITLYVYSSQEVNITIRTTYSTPPRQENFTLWNTKENKPEGTSDGLGIKVNMNSSKYFRATLNRSIGQVTPYLECENGTFFSNIFWNDSFTFVVWIKHPNGYGIEANWTRYTVKNESGTVLGAVDMTKDGSTTGRWYATLDTGKLYGGKNYYLYVESEPTDGASYTYPQPLKIYLSPLNNLPIDIVPNNSSITVTWGQSFNIDVYLNDTHNDKPATGAPLEFTISPGGLADSFNETGGGNYRISYGYLSQLSAGSYTVTISFSWANRTATPVTVNLQINRVETDLSTSENITVNWGDTITIYAVFNRTSGSPVEGANLSWSIKDTEFAGTMTYVGGGNYTAQINTTLLEARGYILTIVASKLNYETQEKSILFTVDYKPTVLSNAWFLPPIPSLNIAYMGPFIQVENSVPLTPVIFTYQTPGPHSPVVGANITLTIGTLTFTMTPIMPGVYIAFVPTYGLPPGNIFGLITASYTNYQTQQIPIFISVNEASIFIPFFNLRIPRTTFLLVLSAITIPTAAFAGYAYIKRARIPRIIRRIDELIKAISRGERVEVKLIPREKVISAILSEELAIVGVEPKVERYIPVELADRIVPLLVESGMKEDEAYALAVELKTAAPAEREKLLESVGIPGETSARVLQIIEEEEEKSELFRKPEPEEPEPETGEKEPEEPESEEPAGGEDEDREAEA